MADTPTYALGTNAQGQGMGSIVPSSIASTDLAPTSTVKLPPPPAPVNGAAYNASVPNPVQPTPDTTNTAVTPTPSTSTAPNYIQNTAAQNQQSDILNRIALLMGGNTSLATLQNQQEISAGIPTLAKTVNDINQQLMGLDAQSQKLQLDAGAGGTIENQAQLGAQGRAVTSGGLAAQTTSQIRTNQIQQAGIAAQALTLKSVLYGAQNSYSMAKTAADNAAQAVYDATQQQINYQKAQLDAIAPQLSRDQAVQAATMQANLAERSRQAQYQREDNVAGNGLIQAALKNNPNDPQAAYAIQQAARIPLTDPQYLSKVQQLVGQYQTDPVATQRAVLENQLLRSQITKAQYDVQKAQLPNLQFVPETANQPSGVFNQDTGEFTPIKASPNASSQTVVQLATNKSKIDQLTSLFSDPALSTAVGTSYLSRAPSGILGNIGAFIAGGSTSVLAGEANKLSGAQQNFLGSVEQLRSQLNLDSLINAKARGATFGALSDQELRVLASSATKLGSWAVKDGNGDVVGYNVDEKSFKQEIDKINNFAKLDYIIKGGDPNDVGSKIMPDGSVWSLNSDGTYTQIK